MAAAADVAVSAEVVVSAGVADAEDAEDAEDAGDVAVADAADAAGVVAAWGLGLAGVVAGAKRSSHTISVDLLDLGSRIARGLRRASDRSPEQILRIDYIR